MKYDPGKIGKKWQQIWAETKLYEAPDEVQGKKNFYHLVMFPYPSGDLHIGHWYNFAPADVYARLKRMQGFNVLSSIGFDGFGLPAENAAIKRGIHPKEWTSKNIEKMRKQLKTIGTVYDWSREVITCEPAYYKWTQWMFLQFYKKGLVSRAEVPANFCPSCKTVLANEQVVEGKCERCDAVVQQKKIEQWLFKISDYAEELLKDLQGLDWPETTKIMQKNWIGKSEGWEIEFKTKDDFSMPVFTTRADTLFGCTYMVVAPEHPIIKKLKKKITNYKNVADYIERSKKRTERERMSEVKEKTGIEIKGIKAINPVNDREIPIFVADYVLMYYGTGIIMSVPAHDGRDWDFAKKYNLPIIEVISDGISEGAYEGEGNLINSGRFNGMPSIDARGRIGEWLQKQGKAEKKIHYRLRDWIISRQRYWGCPIPMIFCKKCGWQPVEEKDLPVLLPSLKDFRPTSDGKSPLAKSKKFVEMMCPKCGTAAERETDTMDTFICSSWYFLRYADPKNEKEFASKEKLKAWLPVNMYIGGAEHSVMHLLYSRFFIKALRDMKKVDFKEPFLRLRHQGVILGPDGQKMSKSRGNVVDLDAQVKKYGADAVRMYLCFMGPYNQGGPWNPKGIEGMTRFLKRAWELIQKKSESSSQNSEELDRLLHKTIKKVTEDIEGLRFNTAISSLMILANEMQKNPKISVSTRHSLLKLLAPFAPHSAEELWSFFGNKDSIHNQEWPKYDLKLIKEEKFQLIIQINGRVRDKVEVSRDIAEEKARELALKREKVKKWLEGKEIRKVIFVPDKLINLVV